MANNPTINAKIEQLRTLLNELCEYSPEELAPFSVVAAIGQQTPDDKGEDMEMDTEFFIAADTMQLSDMQSAFLEIALEECEGDEVLSGYVVSNAMRPLQAYFGEEE